MSQIQAKLFAVLNPPAEPAEPNAIYLTRPDADSPFDMYVTDSDGYLSPLAKQPLNSDLTEIAALTTAAFGRSLLEGEDAAAIRTLIEVDTADFIPSSYIDTDSTMAANSDLKLATQKAVKTALALKAPLASPAFTGNPTVPNQLTGNNTTNAANTAFVQQEIAALIAAAPGALNTLDELAAAMGDDANFATTVTNALATKQPLDSDLTAIAALTTTAYGRSLLEAANAAALQTLANLVPGTNVQAYDAELAALAGLTSAANSFPYFTGSGTAALLTIVSAIRTLLASADVATFRTNAGLGTGDSPNFTAVELGHASDTTLARVAAGIAAIEGETINGYAATATAAGTTTLTVAAARVQMFTGSSTQTVKLPTTSVVNGQSYVVINTSTGLVTVQSSGANDIVKLGLNQAVICRAIQATPTSAAHWVYEKINVNANTNGKRILVVTQSATPAINTNNGDIVQITGIAQAITSMSSSLTGSPVAGDVFELQLTDNGTGRAITWGASFGASTIALPTTTVASTMLRVLFQYDTVWRCIAVA
jgi:hypothetical protein